MQRPRVLATDTGKEGLQAYTALLTAAVKGGETDLAVEVYHKMGAEGMGRQRSIFATMVDLQVQKQAPTHTPPGICQASLFHKT